MKIEMMHVSQQETHILLKATLDRVEKFTGMYESDGNPHLLCAELAAAYFQENPTTRFWVGLDKDRKIVAHLIATIDNYYGGRFVTIQQCWKDPEVRDSEFGLGDKKKLVEIIKEFGRPFGCMDVRTYAINEEVAQILETYGFARTERVMLKVLIEEKAPSEEMREN